MVSRKRLASDHSDRAIGPVHRRFGDACDCDMEANEPQGSERLCFSRRLPSTQPFKLQGSAVVEVRVLDLNTSQSRSFSVVSVFVPRACGVALG